MFDSANGDVDLKKEDITGLGENLVSSGLTNNGIIGKTDKEAAVFDGNSITIDMFGYTFYRNELYKMVTHARVFALLPKFEMNSYTGRYIVGVMKHFPLMFNYNNMCSWNKIKDSTIFLPSTPMGSPDWAFMESYIRAIEKIEIRDVVDWKDKEIEMTRKIVNSKG